LERDELITADIGARVIGRQRGIMATFEFTKTEVVWPGTYNEDGTREEVPPISLPFQVVELDPPALSRWERVRVRENWKNSWCYEPA
jgi:hypothetical protein